MVGLTLQEIEEAVSKTSVQVVGLVRREVHLRAPRPDLDPHADLLGSCAFLTPMGYQSNTLILGPGGFHFGDYWRLGLPLELVVLAVAVPMLLLIWGL